MVQGTAGCIVQYVRFRVLVKSAGCRVQGAGCRM